jgi:putative two-component system response regulator
MATILSIDDDPALQDIMGAILGDFGHTVHGAFSGEEGFALAQSLKPDLILLDMMLPTLNGLEVLKLLKADPALRSIPVFMVTGMSGEAPFNESGARALGAVQFLRKPVQSERLANLIDSTLKSARGGSPPAA